MKLTEKQMNELLEEPSTQLNENNFYLKVSKETLDKEEEFIF